MATRLFLRAAAATVSNSLLPQTHQSATITPNKFFEAETVNRSLSLTKGSSQTSAGGTTVATTANTRYYFTRFVSDPLNVSSITANTWTMNVAATSSSGNANFPSDGSGGIIAHLYVWRPSTQTRLGFIIDHTFATDVNEATTTESVKHATFSGSAVTGMLSGDVLCWEVRDSMVQATASVNTIAYYYDGATENTTSDATVSNHASFIETPQNLVFITTINMTETAAKTYANRFITKV